MLNVPATGDEAINGEWVFEAFVLALYDVEA